jgi:hypothetical protein
MSRIYPSYCQAGVLMIRVLSTLRTAPGLCKIASPAVLFGSNDNSYTVSAQSDMCIYTHILYHKETLVGEKKIKNWDSSECRVP